MTYCSSFILSGESSKEKTAKKKAKPAKISVKLIKTTKIFKTARKKAILC